MTATTITQQAADVATAIMRAAEASGIGVDDALDALEDYTEGPFRPSDWSDGLNAALRRVTPANADAVHTALSGFAA